MINQLGDSSSVILSARPTAQAMAARVQAFDWSLTPLGPMQDWPHSLSTAVGICLGSPLPMFVWWGPDLINIYNDAYVPIMGRRHPDALGRPARELWAEFWSRIGEDVDAVMQRGQSVARQRVRIMLERGAEPEEMFFTYSRSPIPDDAGNIGGLFQVCIDETASVKAEVERERQVHQRQLALDAAHMGWWHLDPVSGNATYDRRYCEIFGVSGTQKSNEEILRRLHPDDLPDVLNKVNAALNPLDPKPYEAQYRILMSDGSIRWVEAHGNATFEGAWPASRAVSLVGTVADVTAQKQSEARLTDIVERSARQARLFGQIASNTPDFIYVIDVQGRFIYANPPLLAMWGFTDEQVIGKNFFELGYPTALAAQHQREIETVIATRLAYRGEVPFTGQSGVTSVYDYIFAPVLAPDGSVEAIVGSTRDVSQRKQAEELMTRDAALLANVQDSVVVTDAKGVVTFWNEGAVRLFGWTADEMMGRSYLDRLPEIARNAASDRIKAVAAGTTIHNSEWLDYRKDGSRVWIETTVRPLTGQTDLTLGIMAVSRDIADRKRADADRQQILERETAARADAEKSSRMKDEFLATLSHELRTPLNAILGWSSILTTGQPSGEILSEGLDTIQRNARSQTKIIEDLLDMSRIINGKVRIEVQSSDLESIVQDAINTVKPAADAKGITLHATLDSAVGAVNGDPNRLQQVFWNLLNNAVKFTPKQGQIQVILQRVNSQLEVRVSDSGEGIDAEFLPHVFDRFRQADASTTRKHGGLGLGLAIVKQLVELHGGSVTAGSLGRGRGCTFTVRLPLAVMHVDADSQPRVSPDVAAAGDARNETIECPKLAGVDVVVVDDEVDARMLLKRLLEGCDATVRVAATADEAMRLIAERAPDVLVSDIGMPEEDGYSLIRRLRSSPSSQSSDIPAVALTAYARLDDRLRAIRAGFQTHVVKPVEPMELLTVVASLTGRMAA